MFEHHQANLLNEMSAVHDKLSNQARFILAVIAAKLVISRRKKADVVADMRAMDFKPIPKLPKKPDSSNEPEGEEEEEEEVVNAGKDQVGRDSGELSRMQTSAVQELISKPLVQTSTIVWACQCPL